MQKHGDKSTGPRGQIWDKLENGLFKSLPTPLRVSHQQGPLAEDLHANQRIQPERTQRCKRGRRKKRRGNHILFLLDLRELLRGSDAPSGLLAEFWESLSGLLADRNPDDLALAQSGRQRGHHTSQTWIFGHFLLDLLDRANDGRVIFSAEAAADLRIAHGGELA